MHPMAQTNRHTKGHGDFMTESAQWGRFSEKKLVLEWNLFTFHNAKVGVAMGTHPATDYSNIFMARKIDDFYRTRWFFNFHTFVRLYVRLFVRLLRSKLTPTQSLNLRSPKLQQISDLL